MSVATAAPAKKATKTSKPKVSASHPPVIDMVKAAIIAAKDRKGTSLAIIKKFITANYKVDVAKLGPFIRRGIVHAVDKGVLVRVKGTGASGSFKVADKKSTEAKPKAVKKPTVKKTKKTTTPKKPKAKSAAKKPKTPKKALAKKPKTPKKAPAKKPMTPKKAPAKKPKTPKKAETVKKPMAKMTHKRK